MGNMVRSLFLTMGNAGFISSAAVTGVFAQVLLKVPGLLLSTSAHAPFMSGNLPCDSNPHG